MRNWGHALKDLLQSPWLYLVYMLVYYLVHFTLLCKLLKDLWQLVQTPRSLHLDPRRFRLCKLTAFAVSVALVYLNHADDGVLIHELVDVDTLTQHAMLLVCMLLAYAVPSTVGYFHDGAKEAWSIVGSLFVLLASSIANLAHRLLSVEVYQDFLKHENSESRLVLFAYGDLALTFVLLVATLCAFLLAGHGLRKWVTHRIEGRRAALICEYRERLITPSGSAACWEDIRREAFRSWAVAHTSNPELLLSRSVLATLLSLILGQCYVVQIYCWSRVQRGYLVPSASLLLQSECLRFPLLAIGLHVVCWRSLLAVALFPRALPLARQKSTGQPGASSQFFMVEDFWIRSLLDSIQFACAKYPMDQKKTASRRCLLIYCSLYVKLSFYFLLVALLYVIVLFGKVWWLILEASTIPFKWVMGAFSGCTMHGALHNVDEYMSHKIIEDAVFCLQGEQRKAISEAAFSALLEKLRGLNLDMCGSNHHQSMDELLDLMKMVDTQQFTGLRKYVDSCLLIKSKVPITNPHGWVEEIGDSSWLVVTTSLVALLELLGSAKESEYQYKTLIKLVKWVKRSHKQAMDMIRLVDSVTDQTSSLCQSTELQTRFLDKRFWKTLFNKLSYHHPLQEVDVGDDDPFLQTLTTLRKCLVGSNMEGVHMHLNYLTGGDLVQEAGLLMLLKLCNYALQIEDFVKNVDNKDSSDELAMSYGKGITITMCLVQTYVDLVGACLSCLPWACVSQMYKAANKCDDGKVAAIFPIVYKAETVWKHAKWPIGSPGRQHSTPLMYSTPSLSEHNHPNAPACSIWNVHKPPKRSHTPLELVSYPGPSLQQPMDIPDPLSLLQGFTLSNYPYM